MTKKETEALERVLWYLYATKGMRMEDALKTVAKGVVQSAAKAAISEMVQSIANFKPVSCSTAIGRFM